MDIFYKIILISLYSIFSALRIYYRKKFKNEEEIGINNSKNQLYLNSLIIYEIITFFLFVFIPGLFTWSSFIISDTFRIIGVLFGFLSIILFIYVHQSLGKAFSVKLKIKKGQKLVTNGAYKYIRHPMYTAFILLHISVFIITSNLFIGLTWILGLIVVLIPRIIIEEKLLIKKFGNRYTDYMNVSKRLIPWIF